MYTPLLPGEHYCSNYSQTVKNGIASGGVLTFQSANFSMFLGRLMQVSSV